MDDFEKFLDVSPYHLVERRVLVETVSVDNDFHSYLTSLVAGQLVVKLHVVEGQVMDLLFSFPAEHGAYGNEQSQHYIVHNVMALNKHIGIVWMDSQAVEFFFHAFNFFQRFRMMAFQVMQFAVDFFAMVSRLRSG